MAIEFTLPELCELHNAVVRRKSKFKHKLEMSEDAYGIIRDHIKVCSTIQAKLNNEINLFRANRSPINKGTKNHDHIN